MDNNLNIQELTQAHNKTFISFEPLLGPMGEIDLTGISWIIIGAMTGPGSKKYQPQSKWIENILRQAEEAEIPVFLKDNLIPLLGEMFVKERQQFPEVK